MPSIRSGDAQVDNNKYESGQQRLVYDLALGRAQQSQRKIYHTLCRIMWTYDPAKDGVSGQGIFLQREEVMVAVVLDA